MKKILSLILCLALLASVAGLSVAVNAAGTDDGPVFTAVSKTVGVGAETAELEVRIDNNPGIWSTQIFFLYDSDASFAGFGAGDVFTAGSFMDPTAYGTLRDVPVSSSFDYYKRLKAALEAEGIDYTDKLMTVLTINNSSNEDNDGDGVLFRITLDTSALSGGEYGINIVYDSLNTINFDNERISFGLVQGTLTLTELSGYSVVCDGDEAGTYDAGETVTLPVPEMWKSSIGASYRFFTWEGAEVARSRYNKNNATANGRAYTMTMPEGDVTLTAVYSYVGDVNGDNRVNSKDLIEMKKILAGSIIPDDAKNDRADLDCNGRVESRDVASLKKLFANNYDIIK